MQLIDDYLDGDLDAARNEQLRIWLEADPANVKLFVRKIFLHQQLRQALLAQNVANSLELSSAPVSGAGVLRRLGKIVYAQSRLWSYPSVAVLLLIGAIVGSLITWPLASHYFNLTPAFSGEQSSTNLAIRGGRANLATLVSVTNCRWDQARSTAELTRGSMLRSGESLHLLEGVAEISSALPNGGLATIQLEGPLAMTLTSQGMPSIFYGHLTALVDCEFDQFALDTPLGRISVTGDASIGVMAAANKVELHVFSGTASLEPWTMGLAGATKQLIAAGGDSLVASVGMDGNVVVNRGKSKESWFITPAALAASRLHISDEYVATILNAKPVAYWRFEGDVDGLMRNEAQDRYHCRMVGDAVRWHGSDGNCTAEFGFTAGPGYLISDDALHGVVNKSYSIEAWVKPTYFHHGALFSLIDWETTESPHGSHRLHLELCGPVSGFYDAFRVTESNPGRIRFIHRTSDCFSSSSYEVRKWQHIAATKDPTTLRLFCNGKLVGSVEDDRQILDDVRVLMGQLYPRSHLVNDEVTSRLFVGELDEVALYDRVLAEDEIQRHVQLVRPSQ
ncbi:MAG TPA: LamG domain-containing protein [Lacipirellulaceae bacterium]|jgi:hypothetical protein|nr:LamG domain-containing protein [Lacipirellulaceae bacterium]